MKHTLKIQFPDFACFTCSTEPVTKSCFWHITRLGSDCEINTLGVQILLGMPGDTASDLCLTEAKSQSLETTDNLWCSRSFSKHYILTLSFHIFFFPMDLHLNQLLDLRTFFCNKMPYSNIRMDVFTLAS